MSILEDLDVPFSCALFYRFSLLPQAVLSSRASRWARNRTNRLRFWAVAAIRNCSATLHVLRSRTRRRPTRCFNSENMASILRSFGQTPYDFPGLFVPMNNRIAKGS